MSHTDVFAIYAAFCWGPIFFVIFHSRWLKHAHITLLKVYSQLFSVWTHVLEAIIMSHTNGVNYNLFSIAVFVLKVSQQKGFEET